SGQPLLIERAQQIIDKATRREQLQAAPIDFESNFAGPELVEGQLTGSRPDRAIYQSLEGDKREVPFRDVREIAAGQVGELLVVDLATESKLFRLQVAVGRAEALHRICAAVIDTSNP